jgi:hypothetical protein
MEFNMNKALKIGEVSKSPTIHLEGEILEKLEVIRQELMEKRVKSITYNHVIKYLIEQREKRNEQTYSRTTD